MKNKIFTLMATFAILLSIPVLAMEDQDPNKTPTVRQSGCMVPGCHCLDPMDSHGRMYGTPNYGNPMSDMELMTLTCTDPNCIACKK